MRPGENSRMKRGSSGSVLRLLWLAGASAIFALALKGVVAAQSYNDDDGGGGGGDNCQGNEQGKNCNKVPEIDLGTGANGVALLVGGVLLLIERHRGRRR